MIDDTYYTVDEIAKLLKVNPQTVRNWIDRGELHAVRAGRRVRIPQTGLDAFTAQAVTPAHPKPAREPQPAGVTGDDFWAGIVPDPVLAEPSQS